MRLCYVKVVRQQKVTTVMSRLVAVLVLCLMPLVANAEPRLLMAESTGCHWCAEWNEEIAHIYPKTNEGRVAPLQRFDLRNETPDVEFSKRVLFTPTFILVDDGKELGRIEGYSGAHFFWPLLAMMFKEAGIPLDQSS